MVEKRGENPDNISNRQELKNGSANSLNKGLQATSNI